ncbi:MAG: RND family efflux transporter MFP subunit, partial [Myxococcota bacterium]
MNRRILAPILVLVAGFAVSGLLLVTGPKVEAVSPSVEAPPVRVMTVVPSALQLSVTTHGTVVPRTESELVPEVSGRVIWVAPSLVSGGFFAEGEPLLQIDALDYEVNLEQSRARLARAESDLANARLAHTRQLDLAAQEASSAAQLDDAINKLRVAEAAKREAVASLGKANRDITRTKVLAPYDGRVRNERVDVGQFVNRGSTVATIYAVDFAEVRLPVQDEQLAFLDLPLAAAAVDDEPLATVTLRARFAGRDHEWQGEIVRTEGELDPRTRMVNVVARVKDPYATKGDTPPLAVGLFVEAEIQGDHENNVVVLPRSALHGKTRVMIVDAEQRLRFREINVLRLNRDEVLIQGGLVA